MYRNLKMLSKLLNNMREGEEEKLPSNQFTLSVGRGYKVAVLATAILGMGMGYFLSVPIQEPQTGMIFGVIGLIALLLLPTYVSYRGYVDKNVLSTEYFVLFFKVKKECLWREVAYKKVKRDSKGNASSICLYTASGRRRISFDFAIVGFGRIVKMAKSIPTKKRFSKGK